ncbi:hypothetical protein [Agathobacter rectalis]
MACTKTVRPADCACNLIGRQMKRRTAKAHSLNYQAAHYVWNYVIYGAA